MSGDSASSHPLGYAPSLALKYYLFIIYLFRKKHSYS